MKKNNIFDEIAATLPRPLEQDDMTLERFAAEHGVTYTIARKALNAAVAAGTLQKVQKTRPRVNGGGSTVTVYEEVVK